MRRKRLQTKRGLGFLRLCALAIVSCVMTLAGEAVACFVEGAELYVGITKDAAVDDELTKCFWCEEDMPYWFGLYVDVWGSVSTYDVKIYEDDTVIWEKYDIPDDGNDYIAGEVNDTSAIAQGLHTIKAKVRITGGGSTSDWVWSNTCDVSENVEPDDEYTILHNMPVDDCVTVCLSSTTLAQDTDDCGQIVTIRCHKYGIWPICRYEFYVGYTWSDPWVHWVGFCPWKNGINTFFYKYAPSLIWGSKVFIETLHTSFMAMPPHVGPDAEGEGCTDYYCWRVERFDCLDATSDGHWWRRTQSEDWSPENEWDETFGEACDANSNSHPYHPN